MQRTEGVLDGLAIGTWAISGINCHDIGTGGNAGASVAQRRRDVDALVPILPQADDGDLTAALNGGDVGKRLLFRGIQRIGIVYDPLKHLDSFISRSLAPPSSQARDI